MVEDRDPSHAGNGLSAKASVPMKSQIKNAIYLNVAIKPFQT